MSKIEMKNISTLARHGGGYDRAGGIAAGLISAIAIQWISDKENGNLYLILVITCAAVAAVLFFSGFWCRRDSDKLINEIIARAQLKE